QCSDGRVCTAGHHMLDAKNVFVGHSTVLGNPSLTILEQVKFFRAESSIHSLLGTVSIVGPYNGDGLLVSDVHQWLVSLSDGYRFVVEDREFAFLEKLKLELSHNFARGRFPHIGIARNPERGISVNVRC